MSSTGTPGRRRSRARVTPEKNFIDYPRAGRRMPWKLLPSWRQILLLGFLGAAMVIGAFFVAYARTTVPAASDTATAETSQVFFSDRKTLIGKISGDANRTIIDIHTVPDVLQKAVLAAEDRDFQTNSGVSPKGIVRAFWTNLKGDSKSQGGSTITQQFVRNYYADVGAQKTYQRKIHEAILAIKINKQKTKAEILQDYLNTIWWGRRSYGIQAAAVSWFPRGANDYKSLDLNQAAFLAAVIQSPDGFDFFRTGKDNPEKKTRAEARFRYVLRGMVQKGWITQAQADAAHLPQLAERKTVNYNSGSQGFLLNYVVDELGRLGYSDQQIEGGGLRVFTTFNKDAQAAAVQAMKPVDQGGEFPNDADDVHSGLASVDVKTGAIIAMYGGKNYLARQINDATRPRAPGSAFKPFALEAAIEEGKSLYSRYQGNSPLTLKEAKTRNEFGRDYGSRVSLLRGLEESINTVYVDAAVDIGPEKVLQTVVDAGVPKNSPGLQAVPSIPLGTADVSPLTMALAYSTFAGGGVRAQRPYSVTSVGWAPSLDRAVQPESKKWKTVKAFPRDVSADVTYALQQVVKSGTGTGAQAVGVPVAGKTGTNGGQNDDTLTAWFVGFSPRVSTAVDFYRGDGTKDLDGVGGDTNKAFFGGGFPLRIWTAYMKDVVKLEPFATDADFPELACKNCRSGDRYSGSGSGTFSPSSSPTPSPGASGGSDNPPNPGGGAAPSPTPTPSAPAPGTSNPPVEPAPVEPAPGASDPAAVAPAPEPVAS